MSKLFAGTTLVLLSCDLCYLSDKNSLMLPCLEAIVCPATKLHVAVLIVEREPRDVDLAGRLEDTGRDVSASAGVVYHHIHRVRPVKGLVGAERDQYRITRRGVAGCGSEIRECGEIRDTENEAALAPVAYRVAQNHGKQVLRISQ